jgi:hypothetical protein
VDAANVRLPIAARNGLTASTLGVGVGSGVVDEVGVGAAPGVGQGDGRGDEDAGGVEDRLPDWPERVRSSLW